MRRRLLWVMVVGAVLVLVFAGVALAKVIECDGGRCEGTDRDDDIFGLGGQRDVFFALGGYDTVFGFVGDDELHGGEGGDTLHGGDDKDVYYGGDGSDRLDEQEPSGYVARGNDVMNGGGGGDLLFGRGGNDVLRGERGNESLGASTLMMYGAEGDDELYGGKGDDVMAGGVGIDRHHGGEDDDFIAAFFDEQSGGPDRRDLVDCGRGNDRAIVLPNDRVLGNCEDVERRQVRSGVTDQEEAEAAAEEVQQRTLERFLAEREANR
jgi:Ca2+-binding RTX toxin-like protein